MSKSPERTAGPRYTLDRITAVPAVVGEASDFLIVSGLVLIAIPLIDDPIRAAMKARGTGGDSSDVPPPPAPAK